MSTRFDHLSKIEKRIARLENAHTIYLGDHEALTRLHTGHRIYVDTRDVSIASHLMLEGRWEPWIEPVLVDAIKPGMRFVDVGANFGYYTLIGAQLVGTSGHVYSFEANPILFSKLEKSVSVNGLNDRVSLFNLAIYDTAMPMKIIFNHQLSGGGWVTNALHNPAPAAEVFDVMSERLDIALAGLDSVDIMKIDVEGSEPRVLAGAKALINKSKHLTIILEFDARRTIAEGPLEYLQSFAAQGFQMAIIEPTGLTTKLSPEACLARLANLPNYLLLTR